jgi:transposase
MALSRHSPVRPLDRQAITTGLETFTVTTTAVPDVIIGVDTHKDVHAAVAIDSLGARLAAATFPANRTGYQALEAWAAALGSIRTIGVEGTGSYGAGLSRLLHEQGHVVLEVNRPNRQLRHQCAFISFCAGCLPVWIKLSSCSRSAAFSFTTYFFTAISLAATNRLRQNVALPSIRRFYSLSMTRGTRIIHLKHSRPDSAVGR